MAAVVVTAIGWGLVAAPGCKPRESQTGTSGQGAAKVTANEKPTAKQLLERMVATYRSATTYQDQGVVYFDAQIDNQKIGDANEPRPFSVAMVRPEKFHVEAYDTAVICDGKDCWTFTQSVPDQIIKSAPPAEVNMDTVFADPLLKFLRSGSAVGDLPQMVLLTSKDPLKSLLVQGEEPTLLGPEKWQDWTCERVSIKRPDGSLVLWIDLQTNILRRIDYPVDAIRQDLGQRGKVESARLTAEFRNSQIGGTVEPGFFRLEIPAGTETVKTFRPAHPGRLLQNPVPNFALQDMDGKTVDPASIAGKATVIHFWATSSETCRKTLPIVQKYYEKYRDNKKIAFWAASVDDKSVENSKLVDMMKELKVTIPVARDPESKAARLLSMQALPATYIVGPDGLLQDYLFGGQPEEVEEFVKRLEKLLAGQDLFREKLADYEQWQRNVQAAKPIEQIGRLPTDQEDVPAAALAKVAPASNPKTLKLKSLWKCDKFKDPGNILVIQEKGKTRVFVCEQWSSVVELSTEGQVVATHTPSLPKGEGFAALRTATGKDGKRYYAASARGLQQVHLFDENWKTLVDFPQDALENRHVGLGDAILGDLDGDGTLKMYVGYLGAAGVQGVDLDGKRRWSNRSLSHVLGLDILSGTAGRTSLLCTSGGNLLLLDAKGEKQDQISVGRRELHAVVVAEIEKGSPAKICVLAATDFGVYSLVGVDPQKGETWSYDLPKGVNQRPIEPIVAGRLATNGPGQWLAPAADGSIHILGADGKLLDSFCYGETLAGLATVEIGGRPAILVASPKGVEALQVDR
jgi:thiol-disulfide isomerase/thioredoxin